MTSSYVCHTCRRNLHGRLNRRDWLPRRTFISLLDIVPPPQTPHPDQKRNDKDIYSEERSVDAEAALDGAVDNGIDGEKSIKFGRYSRFRHASRAASSLPDLTPKKDNLRDLRPSKQHGFDSLSPLEAMRLNPTPTAVERKFERRGKPAKTVVDHEDGPAAKLYKVLTREGDNAKEAWEMFQELYLKPGKECDAMRKPSRQDQVIIREYKLFRKLLRTMTTCWVPGQDNGLPSPAEVVSTLHSYGVMGQSWYLLEILEMLYRLTRLNANQINGDSVEAKLILEEQILSLWSQFMRNSPSQWISGQNQLVIKEKAKSLADWNGTPDPTRLNFSKKLGSDAYKFHFRLHRMFVGVPTASSLHLAAAALLTFDYFTHQYCRDYATPSVQVPYEPFLHLMVRVLHGAEDTDIPATLAISLLKDNRVSEEEVIKVQTRLAKAQQRVALAIAVDDLQVLGSEAIRLSQEQENKLIGYFYGRIKRQIERKNRGVIDQLWQQAQLAYHSAEGGESSPNLIPPKIYSAFLFGYRDLQEPERQADVWNHMLKAGMTPTQEQWGLMMSARMRHLNSMEHIWDRMIASGANPDHHTWCTRISGHIYYGDPEEAIHFLYQWGNDWYDEIKEMFESQNLAVPEMAHLHRNGLTVPRPDTDVLTTVITALVQRKGGQGRRLDLVPDAFAWAKAFAIKPNSWTYNTLFRTCLKDGNLKEAMQILAKMKEDDIVPDAYTFYGFADFVFKQANKSAMSQDEQYRLVFSILDMLERRGLDPNTVFFGSMINSLLKSGRDRTPNISAAMMLVRIMTEKNVTISSHIWTSLMTYYFQEGRRPEGPGVPDWNAIDALWRQMNQTQPLSLDAVFYDRMIEGYAAFGAIARAEKLLERMGKEGKRPGWSPLTALLSAYIDQGMLAEARSLVSEIVSSTGLFQSGIRVRSATDTSRNPARARFFATATEAGLLSGNEDLNAIKEFKVPDDGGMEDLEDGEGYQFGSSQKIEQVERMNHNEGLDDFDEMMQREEQFKGPVDLMPGWDEVVDGVKSR
ncbi:uncharacterized protein PV09_04170 [Verruconis gallopava]|uniref:Pentacotripeptide-repeat region of PRORP domain-containing protein n=1 Tax=Verruconis gallopava TaxID=253628 RepID=A0A0D2ADI4_9PEZI|nr:uncharacterized protein PV09_04170 [Verruconis gallopava]KIW05013.1 hypothetical protein PV09_04170 [Verruconis gallopava]